uniref:Uncharacterized protein n=1 Tax=Caenorhabditis tropicalis TaxID=1561998 RepID=A0A1I7U6P8_9PELO
MATATKKPKDKTWRQQQPTQYGIQSNQQQNFSVDLGIDRPWRDASKNDDWFSDSASLPWHRAQDTPFGKVPIQDNFGMRNPSPMPPQRYQPPPQQSYQQFYGNQRQGNFYAPRDFSPPQQHQPHMYSPAPPFGYSGPPNNGGGGPRSFYS